MEPNLPVLMLVAHRHVESQVMVALAGAGYDDITLAQARLLQRLAPDGSRLTDLAQQAQVTKQSAGFLIDQLERMGYVERVPDPVDARARLVRMARRGRAAGVVAGEVVVQVERQWRAHLGDSAYDELAHHMEKLREITDPYA
jgi:DNA-binding MarR family transcriptional regulator